jgi:hypothetical protein
VTATFFSRLFTEVVSLFTRYSAFQMYGFWFENMPSSVPFNGVLKNVGFKKKHNLCYSLLHFRWIKDIEKFDAL